jgi:hypothetical protein
MEIESEGVIPFLDVLVIRKGTTLATRVYRKPTHTGRYLSFNSNHPYHVKRGLVQGLHNRVPTVCQEQDLFDEISSLRRDLQLSSCPQGFTDSVINSNGSSRRNKEGKPMGSVYIPCMKAVSEKLKHIGSRYNRKIFKTEHTPRSSFMKTRHKKDPQQTAQCVYSVRCECDGSYIGETGRYLAVLLHEHMRNLKAGLLQKSKLDQYVHEEGHRVGWNEASILEIECNSRYRKYKDSVLRACLTNPISQPSSDIFSHLDPSYQQ